MADLYEVTYLPYPGTRYSVKPFLSLDKAVNFGARLKRDGIPYRIDHFETTHVGTMEQVGEL